MGRRGVWAWLTAASRPVLPGQRQGHPPQPRLSDDGGYPNPAPRLVQLRDGQRGERLGGGPDGLTSSPRLKPGDSPEPWRGSCFIGRPTPYPSTGSPPVPPGGGNRSGGMGTQGDAQALAPPIFQHLRRLHVRHLRVPACLATKPVASRPVGFCRVPTLRTGLRAIGGRHQHQLTALGRQFVLQHGEEPSPAHLQDGAIQPRFLTPLRARLLHGALRRGRHITDAQIF